MVEEHQVAQIADGLVHPLVPPLFADLLAGGLAQLLVVGLALPERLVGDLEMRHQLPLVEEPGAESGAEGDGELESLAADHRRPLDVGIVGHLGGQAEHLGECGRQVEARPQLGQIVVDGGARPVFGREMGGGQDFPVTHHPRKPHRRPLGFRQRRHQLRQGGDEPLRRQRIGGGDLDPVGDHGTGRTEDRGLQSRTPDIDGQGEGVLRLAAGSPVGSFVGGTGRGGLVICAHGYTLGPPAGSGSHPLSTYR